jgi:2-dehydro-3-deoxygluconokinase
MRSAGVTISFDVNHRQSLWEGRGEKDRERLVELVGLANILFASASDISRILRLELSCETGGERRSAAEAAFEAFGGLEVIASTHRTFSSEGQRLTARVDRREGGYETPEAPIRTIIDRIGSGDAFAGAVIDRLIAGAPLEDCARVGLGASVLKHSISGDRWIGRREDLLGFDAAASRDIRR